MPAHATAQQHDGMVAQQHNHMYDSTGACRHDGTDDSIKAHATARQHNRMHESMTAQERARQAMTITTARSMAAWQHARQHNGQRGTKDVQKRTQAQTRTHLAEEWLTDDYVVMA